MAAEQCTQAGDTRMVCVGVVTGARGLTGEVRIKSFTAEPAAIAAYGPVADESGRRRFCLAVVGGKGDELVARIAGVSDRSAAEALKGERLYVPRSAFPPPAEDEFYHTDLIGLAVLRAAETETATQTIGRVRAVSDFGAGPVLEVACATGASVLIPFTKAAVPVVDVAGGRLLIADLPGLFGGEETRTDADVADGGDGR